MKYFKCHECNRTNDVSFPYIVSTCSFCKEYQSDVKLYKDKELVSETEKDTNKSVAKTSIIFSICLLFYSILQVSEEEYLRSVISLCVSILLYKHYKNKTT